MIEQALAICRQQIRQEHEAVALGEQSQKLREHWHRFHPFRQLFYGRALALRRDRRIQQHLLERRVIGKQAREVGELTLDRLDVGLLFDSDVKEGARVTIGRGFVRQCVGSRIEFTMASAAERTDRSDVSDRRLRCFS